MVLKCIEEYQYFIYTYLGTYLGRNVVDNAQVLYCPMDKKMVSKGVNKGVNYNPHAGTPRLITSRCLPRCLHHEKDVNDPHAITP